MEIKDIKRIVEMMKTNDLTEFAIKDDEFELAMKRGSSEAPQVVYASAPAAAPARAPMSQATPGAPTLSQLGQPAVPQGPMTPRFDGGLGENPVQRTTKDRLTRAAVESKPHPSLPPEPPLDAQVAVRHVMVLRGRDLHDLVVLDV